jgi:hypothetical protein
MKVEVVVVLVSDVDRAKRFYETMEFLMEIDHRGAAPTWGGTPRRRGSALRLARTQGPKYYRVRPTRLEQRESSELGPLPEP